MRMKDVVAGRKPALQPIVLTVPDPIATSRDGQRG